ncbi:MAG: hypothetical protein KF883_09770 [Thermomicrobiales bacterium]|nr:hypothetical protein [Thermomicrobiales bacterium]
MPRTAAIVLLCLTLATGIVLGRLSSFSGRAAPSLMTDSRDDVEVARTFYDGINEYLAGGDAGRIMRMLSPDYREHRSRGPVGLPGEDLVLHLTSLRETYPEIRLDVGQLAAQPGSVVADYTFVPVASGPTAGLHLELGRGSSGYDMLRIENRLIVERWSTWESPQLYRSVVSSEILVPRGGSLDVRMERLLFGPGGHHEVQDANGFVFIAEAGRFTYEFVSGVPGEGAGERIQLEAGESIVAPAGATSRIASEGSASAILLSFASVQGPLGSVWGTATVIRSAQVSRTVILGGVLPHPSSDDHRFAIHVGRVDLPPGTILPRRVIETTEMLLVTQGAVDVRVDGNRAVLRQRDGVFATIADQQVIDDGTGLQVRAGTIVEYQVAGHDPVTLWRLAIEPIGGA